MLCGAEQGRTNRGVSGALYLQSATAGMNSDPRFCDVLQPPVNGVDEPVPRNASP